MELNPFRNPNAVMNDGTQFHTKIQKDGKEIHADDMTEK